MPDVKAAQPEIGQSAPNRIVVIVKAKPCPFRQCAADDCKDHAEPAGELCSEHADLAFMEQQRIDDEISDSDASDDAAFYNGAA